MKKAGCWNVSWGLESGCEQVLDLMHKRFFNMELAKEIIQNASAAGIHQSINLIVGFPRETEEMFMETVQFLRDYKSYFDQIGVRPMMVYPNSLVHDKYSDFGLDYENAQEWLRWQTVDGTNNYQTRLRRLDILNSSLDDQLRRWS